MFVIFYFINSKLVYNLNHFQLNQCRDQELPTTMCMHPVTHTNWDNHTLVGTVSSRVEGKYQNYTTIQHEVTITTSTIVILVTSCVG